MTLKDLWSKTSNWVRSHKVVRAKNYNHPSLDDEGFITTEAETTQPEESTQPIETDREQTAIESVQSKGKLESLEKLQASFNKLIEQLQGINEHLDRQITQHEDLMDRIDKLPKLLESFPAIVDNQKQLTEQLIEQLKAGTLKDEQFIDAVEKLPTETAKQTDALVEINNQLAASADVDVQMTESFNKFNQTLDKLSQTTLSHSNSISQMTKTYAASDRYLKYIVSRQNKRFMWIFVTAMGVCVLVVLILVGIIIYLGR